MDDYRYYLSILKHLYATRDNAKHLYHQEEIAVMRHSERLSAYAKSHGISPEQLTADMNAMLNKTEILDAPRD